MWIWIYAVTSTLAFLIVFFVGRRKEEQKYFAYQDRKMQEQMEEINRLYLTMRGWRHDYHNHMQKIRAYLAMHEYDRADEYIDLMEDELGRIDLKYKTGNTGVDAILNSKLSIAGEKNIRVKCDAILPEHLAFPPVDLCVLLGNLVDNAVESCEKIPEVSKRFLRIYICVRNNQLYISVSNATSEVIRKLDKEYISRKRGNHGHGLKRIDLVAEKHRGYVNRKNEPGVFATEVLLPLEE